MNANFIPGVPATPKFVHTFSGVPKGKERNFLHFAEAFFFQLKVLLLPHFRFEVCSRQASTASNASYGAKIRRVASRRLLLHPCSATRDALSPGHSEPARAEASLAPVVRTAPRLLPGQGHGCGRQRNGTKGHVCRTHDYDCQNSSANAATIGTGQELFRSQEDCGQARYIKRRSDA